MYYDLDANERANKAALLLAHERYAVQLDPFVKGSSRRLSYVEGRIDALLEQCAKETNAELPYVRERFNAWLRESVKMKLDPKGYEIKNEDVPMDNFEKTDVMDRGEVPGLGIEEALKVDEKQDLGEQQDSQETVSCVRCKQRQASKNSIVCAKCARELVVLSREAARSDYDHWNEDADRMWWEEEGKHPMEEPYDDMGAERGMEAEDAAWEELHDHMSQLPPDDLHAIVEGQYPLQSLPDAQGLDPNGIKDLAANILAELSGSTDPAEYAERGIRGGKTADQSWSDNKGTFADPANYNYNDPSRGMMAPQDPNMQYVCTICGRTGTQDEISAHVTQDHADVLERQDQAHGTQPTQPGTTAFPGAIAAQKEALDPAEDPAKVEPLEETPGDHFEDIINDLASQAAARHFSLPNEEQIHSIASQLGVPVDEVRNSLVSVATFGNYVGTNGQLGGEANPPDGYQAVSVQMGGNDPHSAQIPTDLVINKVAEDMNLERNLAYSMVRDKFGADLPETYNAQVQGQQMFYLPAELAAAQQQQAQPQQPTDPNVGPAFQQTPPGAPAPAPAQPGLQPQQ